MFYWLKLCSYFSILGDSDSKIHTSGTNICYSNSHIRFIEILVPNVRLQIAVDFDDVIEGKTPISIIPIKFLWPVTFSYLNVMMECTLPVNLLVSGMHTLYSKDHGMSIWSYLSSNLDFIIAFIVN